MSNKIEHIICLRCNTHINIASENIPEIIVCNNCGSVIELEVSLNDENKEGEDRLIFEESNEDIEDNLTQTKKEKFKPNYRPLRTLFLIAILIFGIIRITNKIKERNSYSDTLKENEKGQTEIIELFERIKIAEINKDSDELLKYASKNTFTYFENIKDLTLNADSVEVRNLSVFDKIMVLYFRGSLSEDELTKIHSDDLFKHYFNNTVILESAIEDRVLRTIHVSGNNAAAELNSKALPYPIDYIVKFHNEYGTWKYDFTRYFEINNKNLEEIRSMSNDSEDEYLRNVLSRKGVNISYTELWNPIHTD